jgi:sugar lactone lactonase YvrE
MAPNDYTPTKAQGGITYVAGAQKDPRRDYYTGRVWRVESGKRVLEAVSGIVYSKAEAIAVAEELLAALTEEHRS